MLISNTYFYQKNNMASVHYNIEIPLYNVYINLYIVDKLSDIVETYESKWPGTKSDICSNTVAHALWAQSKLRSEFAIFIVDGIATYAHIAHEALHMTYFIFEWLGIKVSPSNHEAQAYLLEYLVKKIQEKCVKSKVKIQ